MNQTSLCNALSDMAARDTGNQRVPPELSSNLFLHSAASLQRPPSASVESQKPTTFHCPCHDDQVNYMKMSRVLITFPLKLLLISALAINAV